MRPEAKPMLWPPVVVQHLAAAQAAQQAGDLAGAERGYRALLQRWPGMAAADNGLGLIYHTQGQGERALSAFDRALTHEPENPTYHNNRGMALHALQRYAEAEAACRAALQGRADYPEAWNNLGNSHFSRQEYAVARACYREALRHRRDYAKAWLNLARAELLLENFATTRRVLRRTLRLAPSARAWHLLAQAEQGRRDYAAALDALNQARQQGMDAAELLPLQATLLRELARPQAALVLQQQRVRTSPEDPDAWNDLGLTLDDLNRLPEAEAAFDRALQCFQRGVQTPSVEFAAPVTLSAEQMGRLHKTRFNRTLVLLKQGRFALGWREYAHRWNARDQDLRRYFTMPVWQGEPLAGQHLIVAIEQGMGDNIQFARYLHLLREHHPEVRLTLAATTALAPLFRDWPGLERLLVEGEPLPAADYYCLLMDLPQRFGTDLANLPARVPYLSVAPQRAAVWAQRVRQVAAGRFTVGLAWQGNARYPSDHHRSFPLAVLAPLFDVEGMVWIKLQKDEGSEQLAEGAYPLLDLTGPDDQRDLMDTAAILQALDLAIVPDSMLAHLAGALARPVWVPLSYRGEWRWLTEREDSPWYPTLRLFRQVQPGDWGDVVLRLAAALRQVSITTATKSKA